MTTFKVGDRVRVLTAGLEVQGQQGVVTRVSSSGASAGLVFVHLDDQDSRYGLRPEELELLPEKAQYKVGDRVLSILVGDGGLQATVVEAGLKNHTGESNARIQFDACPRCRSVSDRCRTHVYWTGYLKLVEGEEEKEKKRLHDTVVKEVRFKTFKAQPPDRAQRLASFASMLDLLQRAATFSGSAKDEEVRKPHAEVVEACLGSLQASAEALWGATRRGATRREFVTKDDFILAIRNLARDARAHGACRDCIQHAPCPHYEDALWFKRSALRLVEEKLEQEDRR